MRGRIAAALIFSAVAGAGIFVAAGVGPHPSARSAAPGAAPRIAGALPERLSDGEFWRLVADLSEPPGFFDSDNLVSNEDTFQTVIPELKQTVAAGGVYLGVGPDQNFTYITALEPQIAFITDIRRGNLLVHLMYKAIIEQSADRADFLSRLFARGRPADVGASSSVTALFAAFDHAAADRARRDTTLRAILDALTVRHGFSLDAADAAAITVAYDSYVNGGPGLRFVSNGRGRGGWYPSFEDLQTAGDRRGTPWSYLSSEARFHTLKTLEERNLIVPLVGNFAGPKALKSVGAWLTGHGAAVSVFYLSNVERYLFGDGLWTAFMSNVAALPLTPSSTFIRSCFDTCSDPLDARSISLLDSMPGLVRDWRAGRILAYRDVLAHSHR